LTKTMATNHSQRIAFIRADGSKAIGMGHINRSALLGKMLEERFGIKSRLLMRKDPLGEAFAAARGLDVISFDAPTLKEEIEFLQVLAFEESPVLFALDVLKDDTDAFYMNCVHKFMCPVLAITDDSYQRVIDADLILNGNPLQMGQDYSAEQGRGKYLLGPQYFLMDPAYSYVHDRRPDGKIRKIMVTLGGSDHNDIIFKLLNVFKKVAGEFELLLVVSSSCGYMERLRKSLADCPQEWVLHVDVPSLVPFWRQADAAITAGGNTLFERIAARVPGATLCQLTRQMEIADSFEKLGVNVNLGLGSSVGETELKIQIEEFLKDTQTHIRHFELSPRLVDGRGLERLGDALEPFIKRSNHELRST
jgi:spore coat polysaccharide biosynthesis predicted glycosyltransferase SpsG